MEGSTSCKGDVLLVELTILLEKSYGNQVKLIEDQLKKFLRHSPKRKLDRASSSPRRCHCTCQLIDQVGRSPAVFRVA